ncbi:MAG: MerR family transcriptional regulator [Pseudomonadota bacterium]|nr:MerR family transcriptional regulator [Pseudomonadota bacterium]
MKRPSRGQLEATELFPIRTVATLTGVNAITLRAWERRYGILKPLRTDGGHRLYGREHIDLVNRIAALLARGMSIGQVARSLSAPAGSRPAARADRWKIYRDRIVAAVARFDDAELEEAYAAALAVHPVETVTQRLLLPVLELLGRRWQTGEGSVAEEHFFSVFVRDKLGARLHHRPRAMRGPRILAACLPEEQHEIGLLVFTLAALDRGIRVVLLAARTPLQELPMAARRAQCAAVVLSTTTGPPGSVAVKELSEVVAATGLPFFIGGAASLHCRDEFAAAGIQVLGTDIPAGLERIQAALTQAEAA